MRSFAAIASFAILAFSAVTSALPASTGVPDTTFELEPLREALNNINASDFDAPGYTSSVDSVAHDYEPPKGIPDVLVTLAGEVVPMCQDLAVKITAKVDAEVALKTALEVFPDVKVLLTGAIADIKVIAAGDIASAFCFGGKVLELKDVAQILADLVIAVVSVLGIAVKVCADVDTKSLLAILIDISGLLGAIIGPVLQVNGGILVLLAPLVQSIVPVCLSLKLTALIDVLHNNF